MKVLRISGSPPPHLVSLIIFQPFISPPSFSSLWQANPFEAASTFYTIESLFLPVRRPRNGHTYSHTRLSFSTLYSGPPKSQHVPFCCSYRQPAVSTNSSTHPKYALFSSEKSAHTGWDAVTHGPKRSSVLCVCVCVCVCVWVSVCECVLSLPHIHICQKQEMVRVVGLVSFLPLRAAKAFLWFKILSEIQTKFP